MFLSAKDEDAARVYGLQHWPTKIIIDVDGKIVNMDGGLGGIDDLLAKVKPEFLRPGPGKIECIPALGYSPDFQDVLKQLRVGDYKNAGPVLAQLEKQKGEQGENAKKLSKMIADLGDKMVAAGEADEKDGDVYMARDVFQDIEKRWPQGLQVKAAKEKLAALKKDKDAAKVLAQEKAFLAAQALEEKDKAKAAAAYVKCADACPGTKFAEKCKARADELTAPPKPPAGSGS